MNDGMGKYVSSEVVKLMLQHDLKIKGAKILILGITFKENCPDVRNTKVVDVIKNLKSYGAYLTVYDPWASPVEVLKEHDVETTDQIPNALFDAIVLTVSHTEFLNLDLRSMLKPNGVLYDVKGILKGQVEGRL